MNESQANPKRRRILPLFLGLLLLLPLLAYGSYLHARSSAEALIARTDAPFIPLDARFTLIRSITGQPGPSWDFAFEPADSFVTSPVTIQVSITGEVIATNPRDVLPRLNVQ